MMITKISESAYDRFTDKEMKLFFHEFFGRAEGRVFYTAFSVKEKRMLFAATEGKKTIGAVSLRINGPVASVGAFIVAKGYRGTGVGSRLLQRCEEVAKKHKCKKIWLWTLPNIMAYNFYKKRRYKEEARLKKHFGGKDLCVMSKFF